MAQMPLDFAAARELGTEGGERSLARAEKAQPGIGPRALEFIEGYAATHERFTCEQCTRAANQAGIVPPDNRAFGPVFSKAARDGLIVCVDFAPRVLSGHAAPGARVYVCGPNNTKVPARCVT